MRWEIWPERKLDAGPETGRTHGSVLSEEAARSDPCLRKPTLLLWGERPELHLTLPGQQQLKALGSPSQGSCGCHSNEKVYSASGANSGCSSIKAHPGSATIESNGRCANAGHSASWPLARRLLHTEKKWCQASVPLLGGPHSGSFLTSLGCWAVKPVYIKSPSPHWEKNSAAGVSYRINLLYLWASSCYEQNKKNGR